MSVVERHRAAMIRQGISRPVRLALEHGLVAPDTTFFDYGCGRGADVAALREQGVDAAGWDPHFAPDAPRVRAQTVNLGYVVNVIEDPKERADTLRAAWDLTERMLVVAARLTNEAAGVVGAQFADGLLTRRGTFQKFYEQGELRDYISRRQGKGL